MIIVDKNQWLVSSATGVDPFIAGSELLGQSVSSGFTMYKGP